MFESIAVIVIFIVCLFLFWRGVLWLRSVSADVTRKRASAIRVERLGLTPRYIVIDGREHSENKPYYLIDESPLIGQYVNDDQPVPDKRAADATRLILASIKMSGVEGLKIVPADKMIGMGTLTRGNAVKYLIEQGLARLVDTEGGKQETHATRKLGEVLAMLPAVTDDTLRAAVTALPRVSERAIEPIDSEIVANSDGK